MSTPSGSSDRNNNVEDATPHPFDFLESDDCVENVIAGYVYRLSLDGFTADGLMPDEIMGMLYIGLTTGTILKRLMQHVSKHLSKKALMSPRMSKLAKWLRACMEYGAVVKEGNRWKFYGLMIEAIDTAFVGGKPLGEMEKSAILKQMNADQAAGLKETVLRNSTNGGEFFGGNVHDFVRTQMRHSQQERYLEERQEMWLKCPPPAEFLDAHVYVIYNGLQGLFSVNRFMSTADGCIEIEGSNGTKEWVTPAAFIGYFGDDNNWLRLVKVIGTEESIKAWLRERAISYKCRQIPIYITDHDGLGTCYRAWYKLKCF
jgi:hypothetical protein